MTSQDPPRTAVYVISCERYETLALCLAGLVGFNSGLGPITVLDDASLDDRIQELLDAYVDRGLIAEVLVNERRSGIGYTRRRMIDHFLALPAEQLVQVEADMLIAPAAAAQLEGAYRRLREAGFPVSWLCTHNHAWCHKLLKVRTVAEMEIGLAQSGSEPFWTTSRDVLAAHHDLIPPSRPDLVLFLKALGATVLRRPEIQAQHIGAVNSMLYPEFSYKMVTYQNLDGSVRQPYPADFTLDLSIGAEAARGTYLEFAERLRRRSPLPLPEARP